MYKRKLMQIQKMHRSTRIGQNVLMGETILEFARSYD